MVGLEHCRQDDVILISDVDEIPDLRGAPQKLDKYDRILFSKGEQDVKEE